MKKRSQKISLNRETVRHLDRNDLEQVGGGFLSITYCGNKCGQAKSVDVNLCKTVNYSCLEQSCGCPIIVVGG